MGAELTLRQKRFCQLYATNKHFFGNGTQTYIEVYDIDQSKPGWYKTVRTLASRLLTNVNVMAYINSLLTADDFNDMAADRSLSFCMNQFSDL